MLRVVAVGLIRIISEPAPRVARGWYIPRKQWFQRRLRGQHPKVLRRDQLCELKLEDGGHIPNLIGEINERCTKSETMAATPL